MPEIEVSDDFMREMVGRSAELTVVLLTEGPNADAENRSEIQWAHDRRNFELRATGTLAIVCRVADDGPRCTRSTASRGPLPS